jgi:hypothetical protein
MLGTTWHRTLVLTCATAAAMTLSGAAGAAVPAVTVDAVTTPLANFGTHRGVTVTARCTAGTRLVGGGGYLRTVADPAAAGAVPPTNGLVLGGTAASTGASPADLVAADGAVDPASWLSIANYTGVSEAGNQASSFALCTTSGGPSHTVVKIASRTAPNATQEVSPPTVTTATCPAGTRLVGGGATTSTPDQVNDGVTVGNNGNLKPLGSYPSNASGVTAGNGSTSATSWSAYGSAGITSVGDTVTAVALCSSDPATAPVQVARTDIDGPDAQPANTIITSSATCPAGTRLLAGGYSVDESVAGVGTGLQPQQGYHMRGSYPSTGAITLPVAVADGVANPGTWSMLVQAGGQNLTAGKHMTNRSFAMCATSTAAAPAATTGAASAITAAGATVAGTVNPNGGATNYVFEYGTTSSFGSISAPASAGAGSSAVPVSATLSGLTAGTTYLYRIVATNAQGTSTGAVGSFRTTGAGTAPSVVTGAPVSVANTSAVLAGQVNPNGQQAYFTIEYGTTTAFGSITPVVALDNANAFEPVTATATGLTPNTTYLYRIVAINATGTSVGAVRAFTTGPVSAPLVTTGAASSITATSARLAATVDTRGGQTSFAFEYGTTTSFGSLSAVDNAGAVGGPQAVSLPIAGLTTRTTYLYRVIATNSAGTSVGAVRSFTTL